MQKGSWVEIEYVGRVKETGEVFDLTDEKLAKELKIYNPNFRYGPITVIVGEGFVIKGLDKALEEMKEGEEKEIVVKPEEGFGIRKAEMVKTLPLKKFEEQKINPYPGMILDFGQAKARVLSVSGGRVTIDFNHPLAGKELVYKVKVRREVKDEKEKIEKLLEFFGLEKEEFEIGLEERKVKIGLKREIPKGLKERVAELIKKYLKKEEVLFIEKF